MEKKGYNTGSREKIRTYLRDNSDRTVSASDISDYMKDIGSPVNITTIYRFLEKLEEEGDVIRYVSNRDNRSVYQYVSDGDSCSHHLHMKCMKCGKIHHLDCDFMEEIEKHVKEEHGFQIECKNSLIYGYCKECLKKKE